MDQIKIGKFISEKRKARGLTQMQLAEMLGITDRAVSKWENGRALPDASIMLSLCQILKISVTDLLNGEETTMENYNENTEKHLLELVRQKEESDKKLLSLEILIGVLGMVILLGFTLIAAYLEMSTGLRIGIIVAAFAICFIAIFFAVRIEQVAGYYECGKCHHKYVPTFPAVLFALHFGRTRYMKCPECKKNSWQKKVISKD